MRIPCLLKGVHLRRSVDIETSDRQDDGANADMRFSAFANVAALRALENGRANLSIGTDSPKHRIEIVTRVYELIERYFSIPPGAQGINHFPELHTLSVTARHIRHNHFSFADLYREVGLRQVNFRIAKNNRSKSACTPNLA